MPIQITEDKHKELDVTLEDWSKRRFYPGRQIHVTVHNIQIHQEFGGYGEEELAKKTFMLGEAVLQDPSVSIIGDEKRKTKKLRLMISTDKFPSKRDPELISSGLPVGAASLGMTPDDHEFDRDDEWFIQ